MAVWKIQRGNVLRTARAFYDSTCVVGLVLLLKYDLLINGSIPPTDQTYFTQFENLVLTGDHRSRLLDFAAHGSGRSKPQPHRGCSFLVRASTGLFCQRAALGWR